MTASTTMDKQAYVGVRTCAECHASEHADWQGSHHDLAMQHVEASGEATAVLGDFGDVEFVHGGVTSRFFRQDGRYMVRTDGADGELADFEIGYTFGVSPLQQYLVEIEEGKIQALPIAWDSRAAEAGGQRWFHLYPDDTLTHADSLHWTGVNQNWSAMCAACHSTGLVKAYSFDERKYQTTFEEVNVSCEACHGPGRLHVERARREDFSAGSGFPVPSMEGYEPSAWEFAAGDPIAHRVGGPRVDPVTIGCAACHAHRVELFDHPVHTDELLDTHRPELLTEPLYFADGQVRGEAYVWGSFVQSKMHAAGVGCADCHNSHSLGLRAEGNALCVRCHSAAVFDVESHHHHASGSAGASCVECHMPERTYMVVDGRRDHSMRVPRPDLSDALGTPNACSSCHEDQSADWAADAIVSWREAAGASGGGTAKPAPVDFGLAFRDARLGDDTAHARLLKIAGDPSQAAIVRATALLELSRCGDPRAAKEWLDDPDPLVRFGAVQSIAAMPPVEAAKWLVPMLEDPVRAIRIEVVPSIAGTAGENSPGFGEALREFLESRDVHADRAWAHMSIGLLSAQRQDPKLAAQAYNAAIQLEPAAAPPYVNLADLFATQGDQETSEAILRRGIEVASPRPPIYHALGLHLVRLERSEEALSMLELAWSLQKDEPRYAYAFAVALQSFEDPRGRSLVTTIAAQYPEHEGIQQVLQLYR